MIKPTHIPNEDFYDIEEALEECMKTHEDINRREHINKVASIRSRVDYLLFQITQEQDYYKKVNELIRIERLKELATPKVRFSSTVFEKYVLPNECDIWESREYLKVALKIISESIMAEQTLLRSAERENNQV